MIPQIARIFGYDAVKSSTRRKPVSGTITAEGVQLRPSERSKLTATIQDQIRNTTLVAWMIRRHLDYVSRFRFQFRTGNKELDRAVENLFRVHAAPQNFDIAGRLGREEMFRLFELEKVTGGDAAMLKLKTGHLQAIESDLIAKPKVGKWNPRTKQHAQLAKAQQEIDASGLIFDDRFPGRIKQFCICNRLPDGKQVAFDQLVDAENVIFDAYYTRFSSQVRGVSPLSTALNTVRDTYEGIEYNLAKAKIHALFGIALMRDFAGADDAAEAAGQWGGAAGITPAPDDAPDAAQIAASAQELKPGQMLTIDVDTRGRVDTIESKTPSTEFREFSEFTLRLALLALDIPFTAIDSRASSFAAMIADQNLYEVSCRGKRDKNLWKRQEYSDWLLANNWASLQRAAGKMTLEEAQQAVEWVPAGFPWLQKIQEVEGDGKAIALALDNPIDAARRRGGDVFANIDKTADVLAYAKEKGVPVMIGVPGQESATTGQEGKENE